MGSILRTPDDQFANLPDFPYEENYIQLDDTRLHYVDEGNGEPVLCLHGEPTWSYLYRKFIPLLSPDYRLIAPDFIGFGKSDKYQRLNDYSYSMHYNKLKQFIEKLELKGITLVVQDWGGLLGLGVLGEIPERFARVVIMNTFLPVGKRPMPLPFKLWRNFARFHPSLPVGFIMKLGCYKRKQLTPAVINAYKAPFPSKQYKAGAKAWPLLVPQKPHDDGVKEMTRAREVLENWQKPALVMFSDKDPIMRGGDKFFRKRIPTAQNEPGITISNAGHFLQEDKGEAIAQEIKAFMKRRAVS